MGTRADFYIGRGEKAEWLGSIALDGYPDGDPEPLLDVSDEAEFRQKVTDLISCGHGTTPEQGWPWPWKDSGLTDYAYAFDAGIVWTTPFGRGWFKAEQVRVANEKEEDLKDEDAPEVEFPNMLENRVSGYLGEHGWSKMDVGISLMYFEETHGEEKVQAMNRFITWAESQGKDAGWVAAQLGHDLNGCKDETMSPRTGDY